MPPSESGVNSKSLLWLGLGILFLALVLAFVRWEAVAINQVWQHLLLRSQPYTYDGPFGALFRSIGPLPGGAISSFALLVASAVGLLGMLWLRNHGDPLPSRSWLTFAALLYALSIVGMGMTGVLLHMRWLLAGMRYLPSLFFAFLSLVSAIELHRERRTLPSFFSTIFGIFILGSLTAGTYAIQTTSPTFALVPWILGLLLCFATLSVLLAEGSWTQDTISASFVWMTILQGSAFGYTVFSGSLTGDNTMRMTLFTLSLLAPFSALLWTILRLYVESERRRRRNATETPIARKQAVPKETLEQIVRTQTTPVIILNALGQVVFGNEGYATMICRSLYDLIGQAPDDWTSPVQDGPYLKQILSQVSLRKKPETHTLRHTLPGGQYLDASVTVQPVIDTFGDVRWFIVTEQDLTQSTEQTLLLKQILENMHLGICLLDVPSLHIVHANAYALVLLRRIGFPALETFSDLYPALHTQKKEAYPRERIPLERTMATLEEAESDDFFIADPQGTAADAIWHMHTTPIFDHAGKLLQILLSFDDVTTQKGIVKTMTDYVSIIAHQLRTPMSVLRWSLDAYRDSASLSDREKQEISATLTQTLDGMNGIIDGILNLSGIEDGQTVAKPQRAKIDDLVRDAFKEFQPQLEKKKLILQMSVLQTLPECTLDPSLARQMLQNLIDNAVKYTPEGGTIDSILSVEHHRIHWTLHDTGIGIPKNDLARVFEKFHRANNAQHAYAYGLGLGVFTAQKIADLLQCRITCESEEGLGTTFHVSFPTGVPEAEIAKA